MSMASKCVVHTIHFSQGYRNISVRPSLSVDSFHQCEVCNERTRSDVQSNDAQSNDLDVLTSRFSRLV